MVVTLVEGPSLGELRNSCGNTFFLICITITFWKHEKRYLFLKYSIRGYLMSFFSLYFDWKVTRK